MFDKRAWLLLALALPLALGCDPDEGQQATVGKNSGNSEATTTRSNSILGSVISALANLPDRTETELEQPTVVVDSTRSSDNKDVMAKLVRDPNEVGGPFNTLEAKNGRFRSNKVKPGDVAKFYIFQEGEYERELARGRGSQQRNEASSQDIANQMFGGVRIDLAEDDQDNRGDFFSWRSLDVPILEIPNENQIRLARNFPIGTDVGYRLEIWREIDNRRKKAEEQLGIYFRYGSPKLAWEPAPDSAAVEQIVERLNQWMRQGEGEIDWQPAELIDQLDEQFKSDEKLELFISQDALRRDSFSLPSDNLRRIQGLAYEGRLLQEATWLRDIARWAGRGEITSIGRCESLFDWCMRNIQLEPDDEFELAKRPWHSLLYSKGTAEDRAWVFARMCQQRGWPVAVIGVPEQTEGDTTSEHIWVGVEIDTELYLFDPQLALPLPGEEPDSIATLAELRADPTLLRKLDTAQLSYPVANEAVAEARAFVVADSFALSRRALLLEKQLSGDDSLKFAINADAEATHLANSHGLVSAKLWEFPFEILQRQLNPGDAKRRQRAGFQFEAFALRPKLYKARLLHFRGRTGSVVDRTRGRKLSVEFNDHGDAMSLYQHPSVRPSNANLSRMRSADMARQAALAKLQATYFAGLLSYDRGEHSAALDWFASTIDNPIGKEVWGTGVLRNRAIALQATGEQQAAAQLLEGTPKGESQLGNRLLAHQWGDAANE